MSADAFDELVTALTPGRRLQTVGLTGAARAWVLSRLARRLDTPLLCVTPDEDTADTLAGDLSFFFGGEGTRLAPTVLRLPADEVLPWDELVPDQGVVGDRLGALYHLAQGTKFPVLVVSARALVRKVLPPALMQQLTATVKVGEDRGRDTLARQLADMGFRNSPLVEDPGTFSLRGDIVDVFPSLNDTPVRLEFFGDTIESMRTFDPQSQRTLGPSKPARSCPRASSSSPTPPAPRPPPPFARRARPSTCPPRRCASASNR
jgi:transcription-repair coupling factor (superfamily II helicase)